ncbi:hypothetical protein HII31_04152 [Pseudocercospora fuligena]|uniref:Uncharacterized protein n=1 Tax=Pseudocercospora fuligena TaxID=685502 RepID=A0A8H6RQZ8_9PEZI|nr:hypothetical protein HII31_04152 [Pseudocercospora fuligena]
MAKVKKQNKAAGSMSITQYFKKREEAEEPALVHQEKRRKISAESDAAPRNSTSEGIYATSTADALHDDVYTTTEDITAQDLNPAAAEDPDTCIDDTAAAEDPDTCIDDTAAAEDPDTCIDDAAAVEDEDPNTCINDAVLQSLSQNVASAESEKDVTEDDAELALKLTAAIHEPEATF